MHLWITWLHDCLVFASAKSPNNLQVTANNSNITISWTKPETAPPPTTYVVEWYPDGNKLEELRWVRLGENKNHAVISGRKWKMKQEKSKASNEWCVTFLKHTFCTFLFSLKVLLSSFLQMSSHMSAMTERCMCSIMRVPLVGNLKVLPLWSQVRHTKQSIFLIKY